MLRQMQIAQANWEMKSIPLVNLWIEQAVSNSIFCQSAALFFVNLSRLHFGLRDFQMKKTKSYEKIG